MLKCTGANCTLTHDCMRYDPNFKELARFDGNTTPQKGCTHRIPVDDANDDLGYSSTMSTNNNNNKRKD